MAWSSRQRVAVARALVRDPVVIVADQPTSLQDETGTALVCDALAAAAAGGAAVLVLARDPLVHAEVVRRGWRGLILENGYLLPHDAESELDEAALELALDSLSLPRGGSGISLEIAGARGDAEVTTPVRAIGAAERSTQVAGEDEPDSDGIPKRVLPFPATGRANDRHAPDSAPADRWREAGAR
jgi:hypothetical protein